MNNSQKDMIDAAITYADKGWHVLPVCHQTKRPLLTDWPNQATTDDRTIVRWWLKKYPTAGIGVLTGPRSGFFVVDIDVKQGTNGEDSLRERFADDFQPDLDNHLAQTTPSGGIHLLFKWDETLTRLRLRPTRHVILFRHSRWSKPLDLSPDTMANRRPTGGRLATPDRDAGLQANCHHGLRRDQLRPSNGHLPPIFS